MPTKLTPTEHPIEYIKGIDIHDADTEEVISWEGRMVAHKNSDDERNYLPLFIRNPDNNEYISIGEIEMELLRTLLGMPDG